MPHKSHAIILLFIVVLLASATHRQINAAPAGIIAYIRNAKEIRTIKADGSDDKVFWTHSDASKYSGIEGIAWRPDGQELAFSSGHASSASLFHADLYAIQADGGNLRKLTNPPDRDQYAKYPKGTVVMTVRNNQYSFQQTNASSGVFFIYIAGADRPIQVTLPPGTSKTLTFTSVADFGKKAQAIVAIFGNYRWFAPGTDVEAGKTIKAPDFGISGNGIEYFGAFRPVWRADGSELSYRTGACTVDRISAKPVPGEFSFTPMFGGKAPLGACTWDWGPNETLASQVIYTENSGEHSDIFLTTEGGTHPGKKLTSYSDISYQILNDLHWLPDGSGFLYSTVTLMRNASNIFKYDFRSTKTTPVTSLENEFAKAFSISPDGNWIVYERCKSYDDDSPCDLWIQRTDGSQAKLLIRNGTDPSWKK